LEPSADMLGYWIRRSKGYHPAIGQGRGGMTLLRGPAGTNRRYGGLALAEENSYIYRTRSGQIPDAGNGC
jgi:hypothetical protein